MTPSPCMSGRIVYIGSEDGYLYAIYTSNGSLKWRFKDTAGYFRSSPCHSDGVVYIVSYNWDVYAINVSDGTLKWKFDTTDDVISSPCVKDGTLYIGSGDSYLYALDATKGGCKWKYDTAWHVYSSPCVSHGVVFVGNYDYSLYAIKTFGYEGFKDNNSFFAVPSEFISTFPNPFISYLSISLPSAGAIYSLTGQLIKRLEKGKQELETNSWKAGVYLIKCGNELKRVVKIN